VSELDASRRSAYAAGNIILVVSTSQLGSNPSLPPTTLHEGTPCTAHLAVVRIWPRRNFVCTVARDCPECAHSARVSCRQKPGSAWAGATAWRAGALPCH